LCVDAPDVLLVSVMLPVPVIPLVSDVLRVPVIPAVSVAALEAAPVVVPFCGVPVSRGPHPSRIAARAQATAGEYGFIGAPRLVGPAGVGAELPM
jgi:hypothetical protein